MDPAATPPGGAPAKAPADWLRYLPLLIAVAALALRLWGIAWALPNAGRFFSYHPDESMVVGASLRVDPFALRLDPGFYNYGSLTMLLYGAALHLARAGGVAIAWPAAGIPSPTALLIARLITALLSAGACGFLFGAGRRLYGPAAGAAAGIFYAVAPLGVQHGHFATVDVPATFFVAGALFFAARHLQPSSCRPRDLLWCGLWSGLAAAAKYNALLVVLAGVAAWALTRNRPARSLLVLLGAAALGFLIGCPAILLNPGGTLDAILFESGHVRTGHGHVFDHTPPALVYNALFNLNWGLGWPLLVVAGAAVVYGAVRRRPGDVVALAFAVPYYLLIGAAQVKFARYTLPLLPPLALLAGGLIPWPLTDTRARRQFAPVVAALGAAAAFALLFSLALDATMMRPDPRDEAAAFLKARGVRSVGFATGPWFYSPSLDPLLANPIPGQAKRAAAADANPTTLIPADGEWNVAQLAGTDPDAVALSELNEYADAQRAGLPEAKAYIAALERGYPTQTVFADPVQVFGLRFTNLSTKRGLPAQNLPPDMLYTNPTTVIFTK